MLAAPATILANIPDLTTRGGRHLLAGALALVALAILEVWLALGPVRRGEVWALAAAAVPFLVVGLPVLVVDATYVAPARRWTTLVPQIAGLVFGIASWVVCAVGILARR